MGAKFYADPKHRHEFSNGAIGFRPSMPFDCLGPYAKVFHCPVAGTEDAAGYPLLLTCYASGYADTAFSVPANTKHRGKYVGGYFSLDDGNISFHPYDRFKHLLPMAAQIKETEYA